MYEDSHLESEYEDRASGGEYGALEGRTYSVDFATTTTTDKGYLKVECPECNSTDVDLEDEDRFVCMECGTHFHTDPETGEATADE